MQYKDCKNSRDLTWKILLDAGIKALPVKVAPLCRSMGIGVYLYEPKDDNSGYSTVIAGRAIIYISRFDPPKRQRFTAAHELGHILLGHVGHYELVNREPTESDNPIEQAANVFASRLLAPACVLWGCGVHSAEDISKLCDISDAAAAFRWDRMKLLYKRGMFLVSPLERKVYEAFQDYIAQNK